MRAARRLALGALIAGAVFSGPGAYATTQPPGSLPGQPGPAVPTQPSGADLESDQGLGGRIVEDLICGPQESDAPAPGIPDNAPRQAVALGGGPVGIPDFPALGPGERDGYFAQYGTAPLFWTTFDKACYNPSRISSDLASSANAGINGIDGLVMSAMVWADDPDTLGLDEDSAHAISTTLRDSLFWPFAAITMVGFIVVGASLIWSGALGQVANLAVSAALVGGLALALSWQPFALVNLARGASDAVSQSVATAIVERIGQPVDGLAPAQAPVEAYYRATAYQAWLNGSFCGDTAAADTYGPRFLDAQGYTAAEWAAIDAGDADQVAAAEAKGEQWTAAGGDLQENNPSAFQCWSGEGDNRLGATVTHASVTLLMAPVAILAAIAGKVAETAGLIVSLMWIALAFVTIFSKRVRAGVLTQLVGALLAIPVVSVLSGVALGAVAGIGAVVPTMSALWPRLLSVLVTAAVAIYLIPKFIRVFGNAVEFTQTRRAARKGAQMVTQVASRGSDGGTRGIAAVGAAATAGGAVGAALSRVASARGPARDTEGGDVTPPRSPEPAMADFDYHGTPERQADPYRLRETQEDASTPSPTPQAPTPETSTPPAGEVTTTAPRASASEAGALGPGADAGATTSTPPSAEPSSPASTARPTSAPSIPATASEADMPTPLAAQTLARYRARVSDDERVQPPVAAAQPEPSTLPRETLDRVAERFTPIR